jgi:hypothetical protein
LFNAVRERAPAELYDALPIDPPPSVFLKPVRWAPVVVIVVSAGGLVITSRRRRLAELIPALGPIGSG